MGVFEVRQIFGEQLRFHGESIHPSECDLQLLHSHRWVFQEEIIFTFKEDKKRQEGPSFWVVCMMQQVVVSMRVLVPVQVHYVRPNRDVAKLRLGSVLRMAGQFLDGSLEKVFLSPLDEGPQILPWSVDVDQKLCTK